jgi:proteasome lid subunit RPN8/RPN11
MDRDATEAEARRPLPSLAMEPPAGVLHLTSLQLDEMVAHCLAAYPEEGCGLLSGDPATAVVAAVHPMRNAAGSAEVYALDPKEHLAVDRAAEEAGNTIIGVFHSHTHTDPYPSPTDVRQAPDPGWHYVLVSLRHELASTRSYRIEDGNISEESVVVSDS